MPTSKGLRPPNDGALRSSIAALIALDAVAAASVAGQVPPRAVEAAARPRFKAVAFDYLVLFDANSVAGAAEQAARRRAPPLRCESMYKIAAARPCDLPLLPAIELAAATLLAGHAPASVLAETTCQADLEDAQQRGHLWVALADDVPVGFAHIIVLGPGIAHLEEIDVHPEHGRRGLGSRLVITVCTWAATNGYSCVTLTTFRDVPWNMPFYARLGFEQIPPAELSPALLSVIDDETRRGLDPVRRVAMRRPCALNGPADVHSERNS